jgi:hypothetical protein
MQASHTNSLLLHWNAEDLCLASSHVPRPLILGHNVGHESCSFEQLNPMQTFCCWFFVRERDLSFKCLATCPLTLTCQKIKTRVAGAQEEASKPSNAAMPMSQH